MVSTTQKDGQARYKNGMVAVPWADKTAALLAGVAEATRRLLAVDDFDAAVNGALAAIAQSASIDRIFVYQHHPATATSPAYATCPYEWTTANIPRHREVVDRFPMVYSEIDGFDSWLQELTAGVPVQKLTGEMSEDGQAMQDVDQALSVLTVPIFVAGEYWGNFGFDDCTTERVWGEAEIAVLQTAATSFAGALERKENLAALARRDELLKSVNAAAQRLVTTDELTENILEALRILGEGAQQDRVYVFENVFPNGPEDVFWDLPYEWTASAIPVGAEIAASDLPIAMASFPSDLMSPLWNGQITQFLTRDLYGKAKSVNDKVQALSLIAVPISVSGQWWGVLGFDDCTTERTWSDSEIAVLETAAACIGSAIERDRNQKEKEAAAKSRMAELAERDRILEATAAAANVMLTDEDFSSAVSRAIEIVGEGLSVDRVLLMQHFKAEVARDNAFGYHEVVHEWTAIDVASQIEHPELSRISDDGVEFLDKMLRGETAGGVVDELPEPFRSSQIELGVKSTYAVPIMVESDYWGVIGLDDCQHKTRRSEAELEALMTLANCIGSAIEQEHNRKAREVAEQRVLVERAQAAKERAAQLEASNNVLFLRDRWLDATAAAAAELLSADSLEIGIDVALQIIGEGVGADRTAIVQIDEYAGKHTPGKARLLYEWNSPLVQRQLDTDFSEFSVEEGMSDGWEERLFSGKWVGGIVEEFSEPLRSSLLDLDVQSSYVVPIALGGRIWGAVSVDFCREMRLLGEAEIAVFQTAASCVGSAIQRARIQQAKESAEREAIVERERAARAAELEAANKVLKTRDRWLQTTATAASELLSATDITTSVQSALATIGENLACDRLGVMRYLPAATTEADSSGSFHLLYEWDASGIVKQLESDELVVMPASDFADWTTRLMAGEAVGGKATDQTEPFRSKLQSLGILCAYALPIFIGTEKRTSFWGLMFVDYCQRVRQLSSPELAVFKTAATCVGSAIYQAEVRRDRAAQEQAKLLGSVAEAANLLLRSTDFTEVLPEVTRLLGEAVGSDRCAVTQDVVHKASGSLAVKPLHEWSKTGLTALPESASDFLVDGLILMEGSFLKFRESLLLGKEVNFIISETSAAEKAFLEAQGNISMLLVPIMVNSKYWGSIGFDNCSESRLYDDAEVAILKVAAESIAAAVARQAKDEALRESEKAVLAEREKAARDRAKELAKTNEAISRTLSVLATDPEPDSFLCLLIQQLSEIVGAHNTGLFLYDQRENTLRRHIAVQDGKAYKGEIPRDTKMLQSPFPADITDVWKVIVESNQPVTFLEVDAPESNSRDLWWEDTVDWHISERHQEAAFARMQVGDIPIGFIGFCFREHRTFSAEQLELIQALANQATLSIHLTRLAEEAKQTAILQAQEKATRERAAELAKTNEAIAKTLTTLAASPKLDQFLGTILAEMSKQLNAAKVHLFLYDAPTHTLTQRVVIQDGQTYIGIGPSDPEMFRHPFPADITPGWNRIINGDTPLTYDETLAIDEEVWWPDTIAWHKEQGHKAITCIPLKAGDVPIGFIGYAFYDRTFLSDEQLEFMQALSNQAIVAIQLTRLGEEAKQAAVLQAQERAAQVQVAQLSRSNQALKRNLDLLAQQPELDAFLQGVVNEVVTQTGADSGQLFLYNPDAHTCSLEISTDNNGDWRSVPDMELWLAPVPIDDAPGFWKRMLGRETFVVEDLPTTLKPGPNIWEPSIAWHLQRGHTSVICTPLVLDQQAIGFLGLSFVGETKIAQEAVELAQAMTNQATLAIHLSHLAEQSKTAALSIALTEERNRLAREIHDTLAQAFTGVSLQLEAAKDSFTESPDDALYHIGRAGGLARQGLSEARRSVRALRSQALTTDTLPNALRTALQEMTQDSPTTARVRTIGTPYALPENVQTNLLRIGQEATTNTLRHARADNLELTLVYEPTQICMTIRDNGIGCDISLSDVEGFGLIGMRERVLRLDGHFAINGTLGEGTVIEIQVPIKEGITISS